MNKINVASFLILIVFCILLITINSHRLDDLEAKLLRNMQFTCGRVTKVWSGARSARFVTFDFFHNGILRNHTTSKSPINAMEWSDAIKINGNKYLVVFDSTDVENVQILMDTFLLKKYNLTIYDWKSCKDSIK
jgi:hypothetical protein